MNSTLHVQTNSKQILAQSVVKHSLFQLLTNDLTLTNYRKIVIGIILAAKQDLQDAIPQTQSQNVQQQVQPENWFDTGDFVNGNEPLLERGRQYPELMETPIMYQQQQQQIQQQQPVMQPVGQQIPVQQMQPVVQNVVPQSQSVQPQQVVQPVQQQQPIQQPIQRPIQQAQQPAQVQQQQQPVRPRPTVEKPPTYEYESNPPPRRKPGSGQQRPVQPQQGQMQGNPQQTMSAQKPQSVQGQKAVLNVQGPQQTDGRNSETLGIQQVQPSGRHQAVSGKKGKSYGPPGTNQAQIQGSTTNGGSEVRPNRVNLHKPNAENLHQQTMVPQQTQQAQQPQQEHPKGYYTDGGFIPATNNNMNNRPGGNQRNQNNPYRNLFNKDRYGYQYQNPLYGAQRQHGRQYNYDYNNYAYGEAPSSNYNYEYNSGTIRSILLVLLYLLRVEFKVNMM